VMDFYHRYLEPLAMAEATPLAIDHVSRVIKGERAEDKDPFGSVYKGNASRSVIHVTGEKVNGKVYTTFSHKKSNEGVEQERFSVVTTFSPGLISFEKGDAVVGAAPPATVAAKIISALDEHDLTTAEIASTIEAKLKTVQNEVAALKDQGVVLETGQKREGALVLTLHSPPSRSYTYGNGGNDGNEDEGML
jgi:hypothetical protein